MAFFWLALAGGSVVKNLPANAGNTGDAVQSLGQEVSHVGGHGNPFQYSSLENSMDRRAWWATLYWVTKSWTRPKQLSRHKHFIILK